MTSHRHKKTGFVVLKVGGNELDDERFLTGFARAVQALRISERIPVIVHGGGKSVTDLQNRLGIREERIEGLRVTDNASMEIVEMVLSGVLNKRIVRELARVGLRAAGISGVDDSLLRVRKMVHPTGDLGRVGEITEVHPTILQLLLEEGVVPVVSPVGVSEEDGESYNVNADHAAAAIASSLGAQTVVFVSNVPGIVIDGSVVPEIVPARAEAWIQEGMIYGGMIPKVRSALEALGRGVDKAMITNLEGLCQGRGTCVIEG
jgi:acetylglutamate kinase